jgi:hypothetical protein
MRHLTANLQEGTPVVGSPMRACVVAVFLATGALPGICHGQDGDAGERPGFSLGPVVLDPRFVVSDGVDTNVFNQETNEQRDLFISFRPRLQSTVDSDRLKVTGQSAAEFLYFQQFVSEQSVNAFHGGEVHLRLAGVTLIGGGSFLRSRERTGYEIDVRALRFEKAAKFGLDVSLGPKTTAGIRVFRSSTTFDDDTLFHGTSLTEMLNRRREGAEASIRYALTPLTTLMGAVELGRDRFERSLLRDADNRKIMAGLEFQPLALLTGHAAVGYRQLEPATSTVPRFAGLVAQVDLGVTIRTRTRVGVRAVRDMMFSFEPEQPYYLLSDAQLVVTRRIADRWDVQGGAGAQRLQYRQAQQRETLPAIGTRRTDTGAAFSAAMGFRLLDATRIAVTAYYAQRRSGVADRSFEGYRFGSSIEYGF